MKLTKDEARICAVALDKAKHEMIDRFYTKEERKLFFKVLEDFNSKLTEAGDDKRRHGRTSMNDFADVLKRHAKKQKPYND